MPKPPSEPYPSLTPAAQTVAQLYGVVAPHPLGANAVNRLLRRADVRVAGRRVSANDVRLCNKEIIAAGVGARVSNRGVQAKPALALPLAREAHRDGRLARLLAAADDELIHYSYHSGGEHWRLRGHLVAENISTVERVAAQLHHGYRGIWRFLAEPLASDLIETLPEELRGQALADCLGHVVETADPPEPVIELCAAVSVGRLALAAEIAFIRVLQGRFGNAETVYADLPRELRERKAALTGLTSVRALIAMLRGDDPEAARLIDKALAQERGGTRKRLVFPDCRAFALSLLSLVRTDSVYSRDRLDLILRGAKHTAADWDIELEFVAAALKMKDGYQISHLRPSRRGGIETLFDGLTDCWHREPPDGWKERAEIIHSYRERAAANGFEWVAAECGEVIRRANRQEHAQAGQSVSGKADSAEFGPDGLEAKPEPSGHAALGTLTLATLAAPVAEWQYSLKALEHLAHEADSKAGRKGGAAAKRRVAWLLVEGKYRIHAYPKEQKQMKNGSWTRGRKITPKHLVDNSAKLDFLLPQDREAAATASTADTWRGWHGSVDTAGIHALAAHPHVFGEAGQQIDVVNREPELSIDENGHGALLITVQPYADGYGNRFERFRAEMVTHRRCEVTHFSDGHVRLFGVIPPEGLKLPAETRSRVLEAVSSLAAEVRVRSAADEATSARQVDPDAQPWVHLEPFENGLSVAIVSEPIPDSGIFAEPGAGAATVFANRDGGAVQARRDLAAERDALNRLISACPQLAPRPTEFEPLLLHDPEDCLELLDSLEAAGARCKWQKGEPFRIVARPSAPSLALKVKSADEWLQASGKLTVDEGRVLGLKKLFEMLEANPGSRFVRLEKGQFLALSNTFRRQLDDLAGLSAPAAKDELRLNPLAALALGELMDGAKVTADRGWHELRENVRAAEAFEPAAPGTLRAELRPYQVDGFRWLARLARWGAGGCLADDMGLGKTVQALAVLLARAPEGPALVVAPTSVVANWADEARRFAPTLNVRVLAGTAERRHRLLEAPAPFDLFITTYGLLHNDADRLAEIRWRSAVLDEAQAIKNPATRRARAARRLTADWRLVTTGTPIQNNLMDLYSLFSFINPGLLGSAARFRRDYATAIERDGDARADARLRRLIAPFLLRRLKSDVLDDLPERTEITVHVRLSAEESALYEALRQRAVQELEADRDHASDGEGARRVKALAHLTRLRLACCHPRLVLDRTDGLDGVGVPGRAEGSDTGLRNRNKLSGSSKLEAFAGILDDLLENHHKVLVFSQFVMHLKLVEAYLKRAGVSYQYLDGSTPARARAERIGAFQAGDGDVFLISLKAGGVGLNLTAADYVIHLDPWWNPAVEDQASDRAHRIGQTRPVTIYRLVAEGAIEEQIVELHHRKRDLADRILAGADGPGRLSAEELLALLRQPLRAED